MAEPPGFTGLGALSLPGFPFSPLPGQCVNSQPRLRALTHRVAPLMHGRPGCRRCRARATGLSPVGPPTRSVPLRVSGLGPVLRLACLGGGGPVPFPPTWLGAARFQWCGCERGDPSPTPLRALLRAGFARCGGGMRMPGEGASCLGVGRPGSGALPTPTTRPFGRAAGAHYPLAVGTGGAGMGTRHQPHCARSCELALRALGAA